jgi:hypothetical protein
MELPVGGGEIEFQANYRLLELGKQSLASPLAVLGFPDLPVVRNARNSMDDRLKKLESYSESTHCMDGGASCRLGLQWLLPPPVTFPDCKAV